MNSLFELNTYSAQSLTYTDNRPATILFDRFEALDQEVFTTQNKRSYMPFGMNIAELNTNAFEVIFEIDLTGMSNGTPLWDTIPSTWTVYNPSGAIYRVLGIQSNYDWFLARLVQINSSAVVGDYTYKASIIYTKNSTTITHDWNILCHVGLGVAMSSSHTMSAYAGQTQLFEVAARSRSRGLVKGFRILATGNAAVSAAATINAQPLKLRQLAAGLSMNSLTAIFPNRIVRYAAAGSSTHTMTVSGKLLAAGESDAISTFGSITATAANGAVFDIYRTNTPYQNLGPQFTELNPYGNVTTLTDATGALGGFQTGTSMSMQGYGLGSSLDATYIVTKGINGYYQDLRSSGNIQRTNQHCFTTWTWNGTEYIKGYVLPPIGFFETTGGTGNPVGYTLQSSLDSCVDMSPDGNYIAIGTPKYNPTIPTVVGENVTIKTNALYGKVVVYKSNTPGAGPYTQIASIELPDPPTGVASSTGLTGDVPVGFGNSVSLIQNGDYLVITTYGYDILGIWGTTFSFNKVYVYSRSGENYTLFKTFTTSTSGDRINRATVTTDGNYILTEGGIYNYQISPQNWILQYTITPDASNPHFGPGSSFALARASGNVAIVDGKVFRRTSTTWTETADYRALEVYSYDIGETSNTSFSAVTGAISPTGTYIAIGGEQTRIRDTDLAEYSDANTRYPAGFSSTDRYQGQNSTLYNADNLGNGPTITTFTWSGSAWVEEIDLCQTPISAGWDSNQAITGIGRHMIIASDNKTILVTDSEHGGENFPRATTTHGGLLIYKKK